MPYKMHPKQFENVLSLSSRERYEHFVNKVADWEQLWVLCDSEKNLYTRQVPEGIEFLPIWPHPDYAIETNKLLNMDLEATEIHLNDFIKRWLPGLKKDELKVGVFPDLEGTVWIMEPLDLQSDLIEEATQYE